MNKFFKRNWNELRGDDFDSWGRSIWFFETDKQGMPIRQIELYENGNRLKYHSNKTFDDYGRLGDENLDLNEFREFEIDENEFQMEWKKSNPKKEHMEIIKLISDYLADHYDQRFSQALFNLGINEFIDNSDPAKENYAKKDIHGDSDEKILERIKSRLEGYEKQSKGL